VTGHPDPPSEDPPSLPPLVLSCRAVWRLSFSLATVGLLVLGAGGLARAGDEDSASWMATAAPVVLLLSGGGCAYFTGRYCFARLVLDDRGFSLAGPLGSREVGWDSIVRWERVPGRGGPASLRIVHDPGPRRLTVPLIYEDGHVLEIGLGQRQFPKF
jgi:hypothetical protein